MDIIISNNVSKPIYEQITSQIKSKVMSGELVAGAPIPSMRALAKSLQVSVITVQKAYENLQCEGFIETIPGKGSFISVQSKDFYQDQQQKRVEQCMLEAVEIAKVSNIPLEKLVSVLHVLYEEEG